MNSIPTKTQVQDEFEQARARGVKGASVTDTGQTHSSPALDIVARGNLCAGCGACSAIADNIAMDYRDGFLRPSVSGPVSTAEDQVIAAVCPGIGLTLSHDAPMDHDIWGPIRSVQSGHSTDDALRFQASSGAGVSGLLCFLLDSGQVDFALHTAADPDNPIGNRTVISRSRDDVLNAAGSRYAPSAPVAAVAETAAAALAAGETGVFVGKPCDVAALSALRDRDPDIAAAFPYVLSFFCAGVPSAEGARELVRTLGKDPDDIAAFRYRGRGWPGRATATDKDGDEASMTYQESWGAVLSKHIQFRCKICADGVGGFADIACGDAWEADENGYPMFEERAGSSLIIARTKKGQELLDAAMAAGAIETAPFPVENIAKIMRAQVWRKSVASARMTAARIIGRPTPKYRGLRLEAAAKYASKMERFRNFLGVFKRMRRQ